MAKFLDNKIPSVAAPLFSRAGFNLVGIIISASVLLISSLIVILMPVEMRGKVWVYNILILPILISAFLFKGNGGTISSICVITISVLIFKQFGNTDTSQGFGAALLSSGMLAECVVYFVIGIAIDFSDTVFGSFSTAEQTSEDVNRELEKGAEIAKLRKEIAAKQVAIEENSSKVNFISSRMVILQQIAREIGMCLNIDDLLKATLNATNKLLKAKKISIFLKGVEKELLLKATYGWPAVTPDDYKIISEREVLAWSVANNAMATPGEINKDPMLLALHKESKFKTLMCAPISHSNEVIGVISIEELESGSKVTQDDSRLFSILVDMVSLSFKNSRLFRRVEMLANTDGLTKLYTHRFFQELMRAELDRSGRYQKNFSVILSDIDHFKRFNDTYGHQAGDYVLEQTAACFKACVRTTDIVARYGGEEFIALLPETNVNGAYILAERIRKYIEAKQYKFNDQEMKVTVTLGVSTFPVDSNLGPELVKKADLSLYYGKENGRNRVAVASMIQNLDEWLNKKDK